MLRIMFALIVCTAKVFEPLVIMLVGLTFIQFATYQISGVSLCCKLENWILKEAR